MVNGCVVLSFWIPDQSKSGLPEPGAALQAFSAVLASGFPNPDDGAAIATAANTPAIVFLRSDIGILP
jgi:hypothetical protein